VERVTDQQYAILDGRFRHLPGGLDEYLKLRAASDSAGRAAPKARFETSTATDRGLDTASAAPARPAAAALSGADRRQAEKDLAAAERRMAKVAAEIAAHHDRIAAHDQSDYVGLGRLSEELRALEDETAQLEERWLELSEALEG